MFLSLFLSRLRLAADGGRFVWSPALDLSDNHVRSALLPSAHS